MPQEHGSTGQSLFQNDNYFGGGYHPGFYYNRGYTPSYIYKNSARALFDGFYAYPSLSVSGGVDGELWSSTGNWRKTASLLPEYLSPLKGKLVLDPGELGTLSFKIPYDISNRYNGDITDTFYAVVAGGPNFNQSSSPAIYTVNGIYISGVFWESEPYYTLKTSRGIVKYGNIERDGLMPGYGPIYSAPMFNAIRLSQSSGICRIITSPYSSYGYISWTTPIIDMQADFDTINIEVLANPSGFTLDYVSYINPLSYDYAFAHGLKSVCNCVQATVSNISAGNAGCNKTCEPDVWYGQYSLKSCDKGFMCMDGIINPGYTTTVSFDKLITADGVLHTSDESPIQGNLLSMLPTCNDSLRPVLQYWCALDDTGDIVAGTGTIPSDYIFLYFFNWGSGSCGIDGCIPIYASSYYNCSPPFYYPHGHIISAGRIGVLPSNFEHSDMCNINNGTYILPNTHSYAWPYNAWYGDFSTSIDDYHCTVGCSDIYGEFISAEQEIRQCVSYSINTQHSKCGNAPTYIGGYKLGSSSYLRSFNLLQYLYNPDSDCNDRYSDNITLMGLSGSGQLYYDDTQINLSAQKEYGRYEGLLDDVFEFEAINGNAQLSGGILTFTNLGKYLNYTNGPVTIFDLSSNSVTFSGLPTTSTQYAYIDNSGVVRTGSIAPRQGYDGQRYIASFQVFPTGLSCNVLYSLRDLRTLFDLSNMSNGIGKTSTLKSTPLSKYLGYDAIQYVYNGKLGIASGDIYLPNNLIGSGNIYYGVDGRTGEFKIFDDWTSYSLSWYTTWGNNTHAQYKYYQDMGIYYGGSAYETVISSPPNITLSSIPPIYERRYPAGTKTPRPKTYFNLDEFNIEYIPYEKYKGKDLLKVSPTGDYFRIYNTNYYEKSEIYYKLFKYKDNRDYVLSFDRYGRLVIGSGSPYLPVALIRTTGNYEVYDYRPAVSGNGKVNGFLNDGYTIIYDGYTLDGQMKKRIMVDPDSKVGNYSFYENDILYTITDPIDITYTKNNTYGIHYFSGGNLCFYDYPDWKYKTQNEIIDDIGDMVMFGAPVYYSGQYSYTNSNLFSSYNPLMDLRHDGFTKSETLIYPYSNNSIDGCNFTKSSITITPLY